MVHSLHIETGLLENLTERRGSCAQRCMLTQENGMITSVMNGRALFVKSEKKVSQFYIYLQGLIHI